MLIEFIKSFYQFVYFVQVVSWLHEFLVYLLDLELQCFDCISFYQMVCFRVLMLLFLIQWLLTLGLFLDYGSLRQWLSLRPSSHFDVRTFVPWRQFDPSLKFILSSHLVILFI